MPGSPLGDECSQRMGAIAFFLDLVGQTSLTDAVFGIPFLPDHMGQDEVMGPR